MDLICCVGIEFDEPNDQLLEVDGETYVRVRGNGTRVTLLSIQRTWRLLGDLDRSALICMLMVSLESSTRRIGSLQSCSDSHATEFVDENGCMGSTRYLKLELP